jgi:putative SOS response-associated peptidase YedK
VIYNEEGQLRPDPMHWELIPSWTRNQKELVESRKKYTTLNIKSEGIFSNKVAQTVIHTNRCLVLASHFFEWQEIEKQKYPHCIQIENTPLFYIAGVWNTWTDYSSGETKNSFGIITTEANSLMSKIHNVKKRMPTILDDERANTWVNEHLTEKQIQEIASYQFPAEKMKAHTVAKNFQQAEDPTAPTNYAIFTPQTLF